MAALTCQRSEFSLPADLHYLNCARMGPLPRRVEEAGIAGLRRKANPDELTSELFFTESDALRRSFARLIGASEWQRVALHPSVSYGIATAARNLPVDPHQNVVVLHEQFPSNLYAWRRRCAERGAELRTVSPPETTRRRGALWNEALLGAIDRSTAVVAIPHCHWSDGTRFDLPAVGRRAREVGAALVVDGTQSLGSLPFSIAEVAPDLLVCAGYKHLLGPYSCALAYFGPRFDSGVPLEENWVTRRGSEDFARLVDYQDEYQPGAIRYDAGERSNWINNPMMACALELIDDWTVEGIREYCRALTGDLAARVRELGYWIEDDAYRTGHLFGLRPPPGIESAAVRRALAERQVAVSVRGSAIRVSVHVYNDAGDLDALVAALRHAAG